MQGHIRITDGATGYRVIPTDAPSGLCGSKEMLRPLERRRAERIRELAVELFGEKDGNELVEGLREGRALTAMFTGLHPRASLRQVGAMLKQLRKRIDDDPTMVSFNTEGQ